MVTVMYNYYWTEIIELLQIIHINQNQMQAFTTY